jgi:membrane-associated phospholipid phosphatase
MPLGTAGGRGNAIPVLEARRGDLASRLAAVLQGRHPAVVFAALMVLGYLLLAGLTIALGHLLMDALLPSSGLNAEGDVNTWLAAHRSSALDAASAVGSAIGDAPVIPAVAGAAVLVMLWGRRFRAVAFILGAIAVELVTYRAASLVVHRDRPHVIRLEDLPVNQSFPSGHVAASVVVYGGLALLVSSAYCRRWASGLCWTLAVLLPSIVALSRLYRGMHHLTDVGAGALMGVGALLVVLIATRACGLAARERSRAAWPRSQVGAPT